MPTLRTRSGCCARAATGQAAAVQPSSVMNSRRFMWTIGDFLPSAGATNDDYRSRSRAGGLPE
jgi:uncharacterized protein YchJ